MGLCSNNCTAWNSWVWGDGSDQPYQPDPDIAGIGIITAYIASSFVTLCFALAYWILATSTLLGRNPIDSWVFGMFGKLQLFKPTNEFRDFWIPVIEKVVLSLSDQQLLTGVSVLLAGFVTHCSISGYHFAIVGDLAWFSSNVHLTSLTVLEKYLLKEKGIRNWRVVSMVCMGILLLANTVMQGHWAWYGSWSFDAQCAFDDLGGNWGGSPGYWAEVNTAIIVFFYPLQILLLFDRTMQFIDEWLWKKPLETLEQAIQTSNELVSGSSSTMLKLGYQCQRLIYIGARVVYISVVALLGSRTVSFALDLFWFGYGVWSLNSDREIVAKQMDGSENTLTFGQIMPLLLLSSTVFVFKEIYEDRKVELEGEKKKGVGRRDLPDIHGSNQYLIQRGNSSSTAPTLNNVELTTMGALQDQGEEAEPVPTSLRRADTEMRIEGRSQASGLERSDGRIQEPQLRRASTLSVNVEPRG